MRRVLLLVVFAVAACTTITSQDRVQRFFNDFNYRSHQIENIERRYDRQQPPAPQDKNVERHYIKGLGQVSIVYCDNIVFVVSPTDVEVLVPKRSKLTHLIYVTRNSYGSREVARGVRYSGYVGLRAVVDNNESQTVIRLYDGPERIVKSFRFAQVKKRLSPQYPRNKRKSW